MSLSMRRFSRACEKIIKEKKIMVLKVNKRVLKVNKNVFKS